MKGIREMALNSDKPENEINHTEEQEPLPFPHHKHTKGLLDDPYDPYDPYDTGPAYYPNNYKPHKKPQNPNKITINLTVTYQELNISEDATMNDETRYDEIQEKAEDIALEKLETFTQTNIHEKFIIECDADENYETGFTVELTCTPIQ